MSRKKVEQLETSSIDKMDLFIKKNYKAIIGAVSLLIVVFLVGYGVRTITVKGHMNKNEAIGQLEAEGLTTDEQVHKYAELANTLTYAKDYINMRAAVASLYRGNTEEAIKYASLVGGNFKGQAESILFDLKNDNNVSSAALKGSYAPLWYYRAVLNSEGEERALLMKEFQTEWPDSSLLALLDKWNL